MTFVLLHILRFALLLLLAAWLLGKAARARQTWVLALVWGGLWPAAVAILFARTLRAYPLMRYTTLPVLVEPFLVVGTFVLPLWVGIARSPAFRRWLTPTRALALGLVLGGAVDLQEGLIDALRGGMSIQASRIGPLVQHPLDYLVFGIRVWDVHGNPYSAYAMAYGLALVCGISAWVARKGLPTWLMPVTLLVDAVPHALANKALSFCLMGLCAFPPFLRQPILRGLWGLTLEGALPTLGVSLWLVITIWRRRGKGRALGSDAYGLRVLETGITLAEEARVARTAWERFAGLMGRRSLPRGKALLLPRTRWVHTFFMRFPIDVVYLDSSGKVIAVDRYLQPWRVARPHFRAAQTVEVPAGAAGSVEVGQHVQLQAIETSTKG